jgi:glycerophosphoryl diester phosphodiesterase
MAGINKKIEDLTFREVKQIELIGGGRIPSLDELLSTFPQLRFNIDFKTENSIESGVNIILNHSALNRVCLASFSTSRLNKIRKLAGPNCCSSMGQLEIVYLLLKSRHLPFPKVKGHCAQVPPSQWAIPIVTKKFIDYAHKKNKFVHVWTIDKKSEMEELIELGVDGLMTDKPTTLMEVIRERNLI